jgi:hypothetical protein
MRLAFGMEIEKDLPFSEARMILLTYTGVNWGREIYRSIYSM